MDEAKGVFLHTKNLDSEFMLKCLQMLLNTFPGVKITSVLSDEAHLGYRVHFSSPAEDVVLKKTHLKVSGENIRIAPLRTSLTIHGVRRNGGTQYEADVRESIRNKFGRWLDVVPVPNFQSEFIKRLRATVDVPEVEELEVFKHRGYPNMFVRLPANNESLKVTFHCRRCKMDGHAQQNCPSLFLNCPIRLSPIGEVFSSSNDHRSFTTRSQNRGDETENDVEFLWDFGLSHNRAGPSSATPPFRGTNRGPNRGTTEVEFTDILSRQLQACIDRACDEVRVLDRNALDDFLIEVKGKKDPFQIARLYTRTDAKAERVKKQLQKIITLSNKTVLAATKEDRQFIRWLTGIVRRY